MILQTKLISVEDFLKNPSCNDDIMNKLSQVDDFINKRTLPRLFHAETGRIDDFMKKLSCLDDFMKK